MTSRLQSTVFFWRACAHPSWRLAATKV